MDISQIVVKFGEDETCPEIVGKTRRRRSPFLADPEQVLSVTPLM